MHAAEQHVLVFEVSFVASWSLSGDVMCVVEFHDMRSSPHLRTSFPSANLTFIR